MSAAAAQAFISEVWGLQGTAYLVVALRYYSRITKFGWGVLGWEDFFMLLATVSNDIPELHPPHINVLSGISFPLVFGTDISFFE